MVLSKLRAGLVAGALAIVAGPGVTPVLAQISILPPAPAPEAAADVTVVWEVKNRFRLFRDEKDFRRHVAASQAGSVLAAEQLMARESDGRGWARDMVTRLCVDGAGRITDTCTRDGARESYLAPADHRVVVRTSGALEPGSVCAWTFEDGESAAQTATLDCGEEVILRARYGLTTNVTVDVTPPGGTPKRATTEIAVRDLLVAGLGDSIASGEGNPDRPVALADDGFCFRTFAAGSEYFRPGRVGFKGDKSCEGARGAANDMSEWSRLSARWMSSACHRSLYSYQLRAALALAIENPHLAVTFLPLACTGATIDVGLFGAQRARELTCGANTSSTCPTSMPGQLGALADLLARAKRTQPDRQIDLVYLTIGANDINFSGLVANVMIEATAERALFRRAGIIANIDDARSALQGDLPEDFARLRAALKPLVGRLDKVVYVPYANPAIGENGRACPSSRDGFDVHPAFGIDGARLARTIGFVQDTFLPRLKALATCSDGVRCGDDERMSVADSHQESFAEHGLCARTDADPDFDRACFMRDGKSFTASLIEGATEPLACGHAASEFRPYASRARWIRTANDSYFAAMTFPEGVSSLRPSDLHDATWGILSAVYGGAVHPTAEGHAAMADAALAVSRSVLRLAPAQDVLSAPLPSLPLPAVGTQGIGEIAPPAIR
ncbi:hypothetical protein RA307_19035 [Xanthobacteraceae bacterium Astr-EGSB]|uniref:hypothetical protein n=1 Tax=Astrobacterium formosum TaxID=3069710 RepID=UPI0027B57D8D|nr:hypothetical protein [Xanthobacteraceae bacterium Astr-EGSB]